MNDCKARILLVDDYPPITDAGSIFLEDQGHNVTICSSGKEAIEQVKSQPFDIIIIDLNMPIMSGIEATRTIRTLPHGTTVTIICMTADSQSEIIDKCHDAGISDFLIKPFDFEKMIVIVDKWLSKKKPL